MNTNNKKWFFSFSAGVLVLTALAKLYASTGTAKVFHTPDELLYLSYRPLMISVAVLEIVIAVYLLRSRSDLRRCLALLWLSSNFLVYHLGNFLLGVHLCPCLGHLTDRLPLPPGLAEVALQFLVLYWLLTSLNMYWRGW